MIHRLAQRLIRSDITVSIPGHPDKPGYTADRWTDDFGFLSNDFRLAPNQ